MDEVKTAFTDRLSDCDELWKAMPWLTEGLSKQE